MKTSEGNTNARVAHGEAKLAVDFPWNYRRCGDGYENLTVFGELDRVVDEVDQNLADSGHITQDGFGHAVLQPIEQFKALCIGRDSQFLDGALNAVTQTQRCEFGLEVAGVDPREIQYVIDKVKERLSSAKYGMGVFPLLWVEGGGSRRR